MAILAGIVLGLNYLLSLVVGVRLLGLPASGDHRPERMLAVHYLIGIFAGGIAVTAAYAAWSSPEIALSEAWVQRMHAFGGTAVSIGAAVVYFFTWQTFRAGSSWAAAVSAVGITGLGAGLLGRALLEGWAIRIEPGFFHWELYSLRVGALVWVATESLLYHRRSLKRLKLGLIRPIVADRFLLWGGWAVASTFTALSEPAARLTYGFLVGDRAGSAASIEGVAAPIIAVALVVASVTGMASATTLFLTFFPTPAYHRWVDRRAAARSR